MSAQTGSKADEEIRSEPGVSTSAAAVSRRRIIYRPFSINPQTSTTTVTATIRDTLIAVRDAVAASIMTTSSSILPRVSTNTAETASINIHSSTSTSNVSQQHTVCSTNPETNVATPTISAINKVPRRWEQWNSSEINAFFEGIKMGFKAVGVFQHSALFAGAYELNRSQDMKLFHLEGLMIWNGEQYFTSLS
ncbi:hypothetical protein WUBG_05728 [Wuchereria bancrofti]|uniref:Uncharacterized protein n=1 Tax=Wuchereria bancrofti TaxID=6293 RepID=J9ELJ1_WUCBA|nr:hypothetical protein WUBG_05728 [Wuchereria bancrofti]